MPGHHRSGLISTSAHAADAAPERVAELNNQCDNGNQAASPPHSTSYNGRTTRRAPTASDGLPPTHVEALVRRDPIQPGADRGALLETVKPTPRQQHRVLQRVLGILTRAEHAVAV